MGSHKIDIFVLSSPAFFEFLFFCKYWPNFGLLRLKLVANSRITIKYYIVMSDGVHILFYCIKCISYTTVRGQLAGHRYVE